MRCRLVQQTLLSHIKRPDRPYSFPSCQGELALMPLKIPPRGPFSSSSSDRLLATSSGERLSGRWPGLKAARDMAASVIMSFGSEVPRKLTMASRVLLFL